jgi:hypothetical protein
VSDQVQLVKWRGGVWKVVPREGWYGESISKKLLIRWVCGFRPDEGIFQEVAAHSCKTLTILDALALASEGHPI